MKLGAIGGAALLALERREVLVDAPDPVLGDLVGLDLQARALELQGPGTSMALSK